MVAYLQASAQILRKQQGRGPLHVLLDMDGPPSQRFCQPRWANVAFSVGCAWDTTATSGRTAPSWPPMAAEEDRLNG